MEIELVTDAMSVFAATTANHVKMPAEKSLLSHIQFLRELCDKYIVTCLTWCDTRDMVADGLTKGKCERDSVATAMAGSFTMKMKLRVGQRLKQSILRQLCSARVQNPTKTVRLRWVAMGLRWLAMIIHWNGKRLAWRRLPFARHGRTFPVGLPRTGKL